MKKVVAIFVICLVSCSETIERTSKNSTVEFYKFFDPFSFKGVQILDSTTKDFPFYKIYYDSLKNIIKFNEYLSENRLIISEVKYKDGVKIIQDSSSGIFEHESVNLYQFYYTEKMISIYNYYYGNTNRSYTKLLKIYTPNKVLEYTFFGDGKIGKADIDSSYLKKITYLDPKSVLANKLNFNEEFVEEKSIRDISNTQNEIIVKTLYTNRDTTVNQTFNYSSKKYDKFWVAKYNFLDSIAAKLYYDKHYKNL